MREPVFFILPGQKSGSSRTVRSSWTERRLSILACRTGRARLINSSCMAIISDS